MSESVNHAARRVLFNDSRGGLFAKAYFKPSNVRAMQAVNESDPNSLGDLETQLMLPKFNELKKLDRMKDNDVHYEITDIITRAALWHREFDKPAERGTRVESIRKAIEQYVNVLTAEDPSAVRDVSKARDFDAVLTVDSGSGAIAPVYQSLAGLRVRGTVSHLSALHAVALATVSAGHTARKSSDQVVDDVKNAVSRYSGGKLDTLGEEIYESAGIESRGNGAASRNVIYSVKDVVNQRDMGLSGDDRRRVKNYMNESAKKVVLDRLVQLATTLMAESNPSDRAKEMYANLGPVVKAMNEPLVNAVHDASKRVVMEKFPRSHVRASEESAVEVWQKAFKDMSSFDKETRDLLSQLLSLYKVDQYGGETEIPSTEWDRELSRADLQNYRINLKKDRAGSTHTVFEKLIPRLPSKIKGVWYTKPNGTRERVDLTRCTEKSNFLRQLYHEVYNPKNGVLTSPVSVCGQNVDVPTKHADAGKLEEDKVHYDIPNLVRSRLYAAKSAATAPIAAPEPVTPAATAEVDSPRVQGVVDLITRNTWLRSSSGTLYRVDKDGKHIKYGSKDQTTQDLLQLKNNCYTTLVNGADNKECEDYVFKCLLNDDSNSMEQCLDKLSKENFYEGAMKEINNMHPLVALRTLEKFGFQSILGYDETARMKIRKVQSVEDWIQNYMTKKFTSSDVQKVISGGSRNTRLIEYLRLVSEFVNRNPTLLNKGFNGETDETTGKFKQSALASSLGIETRVEPNAKSAPSVELNLLQKHMKTSFHGATASRTPFDLSNPFGGIGAGFPSGMGMMRGGGGSLTDALHIEELVSRVKSSKAVIGGELLRDLLSNAISSLESRGKHLDSSQREEIEGNLDKVIQMQDKLSEVANCINEYITILDYFKDYNNDTLDLKNLKQMVSRRGSLMEKLKRSETNMVTTLQAITNINDESGVGQEHRPIATN